MNPEPTPAPHHDRDRDQNQDQDQDQDQGQAAADDHGAYQRLLADLEAAGADYRVVEHAPEGRTEAVSALRGHPVAHAAKCLVVMVKTGKKTSRYVLAVIPGGARADLDAIKDLIGGTYVSFASTERAEELAGSVSGTVLPFAGHEHLELIADPAVLDAPQLWFNAARLDRSIVMPTTEWERVAGPRIATITAS